MLAVEHYIGLVANSTFIAPNFCDIFPYNFSISCFRINHNRSQHQQSVCMMTAKHCGLLQLVERLYMINVT